MAHNAKLTDAIQARYFKTGDVRDYARFYPSVPDRLREIVAWLERNLEQAGLAFMVERIGDASARHQELWEVRFGLTPAEVRLAAYLVHGGTVAGYAKQHGVSRNTVRNQLQAVYGKTGTHRQAELVALLLRA